MQNRRLIRAAIGLLLLGRSCIALSPSFSGEDPCPTSCAEAGVDPGNWTVYHSADRLAFCTSSLILYFSAFNFLDDPLTGKTLRACVVDHTKRSHAVVPTDDRDDRDGKDSRDERTSSARSLNIHQHSINETVTSDNDQHAPAQALWNGGPSTLGQVDISGLGEQLQAFLDAMDASKKITEPKLLFIHNSLSSTSIGIYAGTGVPTSPMINALSGHASSQGYSGDTLVQACNSLHMNDTAGANSTSPIQNDHSLSTAAGIVAASGPQSLAIAQRAVSQWANSSCVTEGYASKSALPTKLQTVALAKESSNGNRLAKRGACSTTSVRSGDLCADLAKRCGISTVELIKYNSKSDFCTTLRVPQLVCCSSGELPIPKPDGNGNCQTHEVKAGQSCWSIANDNSNLFSIDDLEKFNKNTWGWGGCNNLQATTIICLSPGNPPLPKPIPNAMCGPVKPGTVAPPPGTNLATLNPCPLNSCCDVWGFCGTTEEFCRPVPAGQAPGAPQPVGAPICISNCGTDIVNNGSPPSSFISIGYFEGYGISRSCQTVDIRDIDISKYTHIHFAFATITPGSYEVDMGPTVNQYYYFKRTSGVKKILSFGGWTFSTDPATYGIFREGVLGANRDRMAQNIANFIINEGLDGVDIDWEYPAAPDLPDIPTADPEEGENYYLFLKKLRSILPSSKSVSFAAPASFWYLRGFPIAKIINVVDYVVYMTYDLHGQWDYDNKWTDSGCPGGNCLRSHINATETMNALSMITKAGVPTNKITVGIASYGRSFQMTDPSCTGPMCTYTGKASGAIPGRCTGTAGYISNAEIRDILATNPTARKFSDGEGGDVLVYDKNQWVSYMDDDTKARRINMYRNMNFLGTTDWAISLDNAGLIDSNSGVDDTDNDESGDLGLGNLPGLVFKEKKRKLGKGAVQPQYHKSCNEYKKSMQQSWKEAGEIADATMKWSPNNKFQRALDIYFGFWSLGDEKIFRGNFQRLWESHWGHQKMLGMNLHATFFCGSGAYPEIYGEGAPFVNYCPLGNRAGTRAGRTIQLDKDPKKKSHVFTVFCDLATSSTQTWSLKEAEKMADDWDYHLKSINMWKQSVRPVIFYHENMHWKRVSDPWCGATIGTTEKAGAITEQYSLKEIMHLPYSMRRLNAENWAVAAIAMWIMDTWDVAPPVPVYGNKRDDLAADSEMDDSEHYDPEWEAEMEKAERLFQEKFDPARLNPADFKPLFDDDDEQTSEFKHECSEGRWLSSLQCSLMCQGGICTETFDGNFFCSNCNATNDEAPYRREEFQDTFNDSSMSEWKTYQGHFEVSAAGLVADGFADGVALIYRRKTADFIFEGSVTLPAAETGGDAGLIFRAANPNETESSGYYYAGISSSSGKVFLKRMPADVQLASAAATNVVAGKPAHIKVQAVNETISVFLSDMDTPKIVQKDTALRTGFNGVRVHGARATFNNITVTPVVRQKGIVDNCSGFYRAVAGDTCQTIIAKHSSTSISLAQLHSWNPALQDDCSGLKTDYFYCVAREDAFRLQTKYHNDCTGEVHNDVVLGRDEGKCIDTGCSVASMDIASAGDCPSGQVQISYWEQPGCSGQWFGYGYASRDTCRPLWSEGWKFGSLHLRCAEPLSDCVSQGQCVPDKEPARGICEAPPPPPPPAFKLRARYTTDCGGDVHQELSVEQGNGLCVNTGCRVGSLEIAALGDCPDGEVRISYWGGEDCGGAWYGYGYASRNTCRSLWSAGWKFKSLWLSCAKQSDDCVNKKSCTEDPAPAENIC